MANTSSFDISNYNDRALLSVIRKLNYARKIRGGYRSPESKARLAALRAEARRRGLKHA